MIIGIDASMLVYHGSGVATYTYNLIQSLLKYAPHHEYRIFYSSFRLPNPVKQQLVQLKNTRAKIFLYRFPPRVLNFLWNRHHLLPVEWCLGKVDFFFSSDYLRPPLLSGTRGITTIHDLTWKLLPKFHTPLIVAAHDRKLAKTIRFQDIVVVDSYNTKKDLLKLYPHTKNNNHLEVIYPGINENFKEVTHHQKLKKQLSKYGIDYPSKYLLYVGAVEPRKNLSTAIKIFSQLVQKKEFSHYKFFIAGRAGWKNEAVFAQIKKLKLENKVIFLGFVAEADLSALYSAASANIYLSQYEGFGLPPLEAAACETPTLLYRHSSLSELFPADYPYAMPGDELKTLIKILTTKKLTVKKYTKPFTWQNYVEKFDKMISYATKK